LPAFAGLGRMRGLPFVPRFLPLAFCAICAPLASAGYTPRDSIPLPGDSGWDYLTADAGGRRLYVTHGDRVQVLDLDRLIPAGEIASLAGAHGVALAPELGRGFISNGKTSAITVFDLKTLAILATWPAGGKKPDAILYDTATRRLCSFNGGSANATVIDAATGTLVGAVPLGGTPEFAASDGTGQIYVNIEDRGETVRFDARTLGITARWSLAPAHTPTALAFDQAHHRLFVGCRSGSLVVLSADSGGVVATLPIGGGVDAVSFFPAKGLVVVSNSDGTLNLFHQVDADHYTAVETVSTAPGARTHAVDPATGRVFLASARYLPAPKPAPDQKPARPAIEPGSFRVLVFQP
jgi:DNA-binding beta-propeller fold protein YncE